MKKLLWSQDKYLRAYNFAVRAHRDQLVPGTDLPYVTHISLVSMEIMAALSVEPGHEGNLALQCALLHDVVEDAGVTVEQVRVEFGEPVAKGVAALSKNSKLEKSIQMADSLRRIREQPHEVWMVKLADRITNLAPPPNHWTKEKIARYRDEAREIHQALHPASAFLADRLNEKIEAYRKYLLHGDKYSYNS